MAQCIFCGFQGKLSKEHLWAKWLAPYITKDMESYRSGSVIFNLPGTAPTEVKKKIGGDPRSRTSKCVCEPCNNGWMGDLQEDAKSVVIPLLTGDQTTLHTRQQKLLASWIAMAVMCAEHAQGETNSAIPQKDRVFFFRNRVLPKSGWRIWIGRYKRDRWSLHWTHHALTISSEKEVLQRTPGSGLPPFNTQSTTYVVGELYIHVMSSAYRKAVRLMKLVPPASDLLYEIWPPGRMAVWPPIRPLSDSEAHNISVSFFKAMRKIGSNE